MNNRFYTHYEALFNNQTVNTRLEHSLYTKLFKKKNFLSLLSMKKIISFSAGLAGAGVAVAIGIALLYPSQSVTAEDILKHAGQLISPKIASGEMYTATRTITEEQTNDGKILTTTQKELYFADDAGQVRLEIHNANNELTSAVLYLPNGMHYGYGYDMYRFDRGTPTILHQASVSSSMWDDTKISETDKQAIGMTGDSPQALAFGDSMLRKWASGTLDATTKFFTEPVLVGEEILNGKTVYKIVHQQGTEFIDTVWIEKDSNRLVREETEMFIPAVSSAHTKTIITYDSVEITKNMDAKLFTLEGWKQQYGLEQATIEEISQLQLQANDMVIGDADTSVCGGTLPPGDLCADLD